ncbi:hypothetical protein KUTeg_017831 [Tegillarca granosa]|uniref:Roc domain-containing protein n=1 Tax=Tegillarca granosa TaxID=220873 RepID=A0ABQ9EG36_TEGGR|nr:hypothetical protein KUTeg_017831 [Tegillarca granosa]
MSDLSFIFIGDHYDVAEFLVEVGANLTRKICETFPEITWHILCKGGNCIEEEEEDLSRDRNYELPVPLHKGVFAKMGLGGFHIDWLKPYRMSLVEIDLRDNEIEVLPTSIPWSFPVLKILNVSNNCLKAILPPVKDVFCDRLEEILLMNNKLEDLCYQIFRLPRLKTLNLSNNKLQYLVKTHQQQHDWNLMRQDSDAAKAKREWILPSLTYLNVSNNELEMLPPDIKNCTALVRLDASNNRLTAFPPAWNCKMTSLDLSNNELERFPVSAEQFWCGTLRCLKLNNNYLEEINESIVKLCTLTDLCASNNKIYRLPSAEVWDCKQLYLLDLSGNQLKASTQPVESPTAIGPAKFFKINRPLSVTEDMSSTIIFPQFLAHSLHDLNLSNNDLEVVPSSVCHMTSLEILDLSDNPSIKTFPPELGRLKTCHNLILNGLNIENIPKEILQVKEVHKRSKDIISLLRNELRQSQKYYTMKLVVLGKKEKGKTTLINILGGKSEDSHLNVGIRTSSIVIPHPTKRKFPRDDSKPNFIFNTWDMAGDEAYIPTQQCFLTQNSIYFLVWDLWSLKDDIDKLGTWLYSLEVSQQNSYEIIEIKQNCM